LTIIQPRHNSLEQPRSTADSTADSFPELEFIARLGSVTLLDFPLKMVADVNSVPVVFEIIYSSCRAVPPSDVASSSVDMTGMLDCLIHFRADFWYHVNFVRLNWDVGSGGLQLCSFGLTRQVLKIEVGVVSTFTDFTEQPASSALRSGQRVGDDVMFRAELTESVSTPEYIPPLRHRCHSVRI
jgi:hypothetical protein